MKRLSEMTAKTAPQLVWLLLKIALIMLATNSGVTNFVYQNF